MFKFNFFIKQYFTFLITLSLFALVTNSYAANNDDITFDDTPLDYALVLPDWFKLSFLEIKADIEEAKEQNKKGIIIYFGQKFCPYCKARLDRKSVV